MRKIITIVVLLGSILIAFIPCAWLMGKNQQDEIVLVSPIWGQRHFGILFTHSVALSPVEEWFYVEDETIILNSTIYEDFGAGLPHEADAGQRMSFKDGKIFITGYDVRIPNLVVRVGRIANHALLLPELFMEGRHVLSLHTVVKPGQSISFTVQKISLFAVCSQYVTKLFI